MKRKILALFIALFTALSLSFALYACKDQEETDLSQLNFTLLDNGTYSVSAKDRENFNLTELKIPSSYNGKAVTQIGKEAFTDCSSIKSVEIPNGVTGIGYAAFSGCTSLESAALSDSITIVGSSAFYECGSLKKIEIPESVTDIFYYAFSACSSLEEITVASGNKKYYSAGNCIIERASKSVVAGCNTSVIPSDGSVSSIGNCAFVCCFDLESIEIPEGVTIIGQNAFDGCHSLKKIDIPASVTDIDYVAFGDCNSLEEITVASGNTTYYSAGNCIIEKISKSVVVGCNTSVIPSDGSIKGIGGYAFVGCENIKNIDLPDGMTSIDAGAFYYCRSLKSIAVPYGVTKISFEAFKYCSALESIEIPESVVIIDNNAFEGCSALTEINFKGTKAQWKAIDKGSLGWNKDTGEYTVKCTDGTLTKAES